MYEEFIKEAMQLNEMAYNRNDAIEICSSLGMRFIEHFHKVMDEGKNGIDYHHHCSEMQAWFDTVKEIVLKQNKKLISANSLIDWFFTAGSDVEHRINEDYQETYEQLYLSLLSDRNNSKVEEVMNSLMY